MADLMEYVNVLADQIGPRPVSTEEEHQASLFVAQELTEDGLDVSVDEFATPSGVRWPYVIAFVASTLGTVISGIGVFVPGISLSMFILGLLLVAGGLFIYFTEYNNQPFLSKMRANGVSQNVVAKYIPESVARETRRRKKVIICAHVDTVRAQPEASPKLIAHAPLLHKVIFYCMIGLVAVLFIRLLPLPWPEVIDTILWIISLVACAYILCATACIVASHFTPYISGGNDNASSIAVLLAVAHFLVSPAERERFTKERTRSMGFADFDSVEEEYEETFAPELDDVEEPVMHGLDEAYDEGLIPGGVEATYDEDGVREDATVAFPALTPEEQLDVLADTAAEEFHLDTMSTGAFSLDDVEFSEEEAEVVPERPGAISDMKVPDLDVELDVEIDQSEKKPVERVDDSIIFAEYMSAEDEDDQEEVEAVEEVEAEVVEPEPQPEEEPEVVEAESEVIVEETVEPAPIYKPIQTRTRNREESTPQVARPVPSWYAAAKEKAAKDMKKRAAHEEQEDPSVFSYRSRFADAPAAREVEEEKREGIGPQDDVIEKVEIVEERVEAEFAEEKAAQAEVEEAVIEEEAAEVAAVVEADIEADEQEQEQEQEPIDLEILDDQLDELSPEASGLFMPVEAPKEDSHVEKSSVVNSELPRRIPNIGSSDDRQREERKIAHENIAARSKRSELQNLPDVDANEDIVVDGAGLEVLESTGSSKPVETVEAVDIVEPVVPATARAQRKKPTARHVTQQFVPTRASNRGIQLGENRQEAPVSSTYEETEQAAPAVDPFAPKDEARVAERSERSSKRRARPTKSKRTEYAASATYSHTVEASVSPSNTSSFPALTGSFPALRDNMPTVDAGDFAATSSEGGVIADDAALESFMAASQTTEINIPESRFRNAVDKVGGLFGRKNKDDDYNEDAGDAWGDEDDYGWKGGGYFEEETESALDAARQRAAQIREQVVSMTEHDLMDKEVWFVALGASGAGAQGMKNFIDLHSSELRGALIINLEAVGAGKLSYIESEGTGKPHRADRRLMSLVRKASKELKGTEMKPTTMDWRDTDATPAMIAGLRALSIMGISDNGVAPVDWHTAADTAGIVEENKLEYMTRLLLKVIENS